MSLKTKMKFKNIAKIIGGILFTLILFTNIKIALLDNQEIVRGDISILGIEMSLFDATYGENNDPVQYSHTVAMPCLITTPLCCGYVTVTQGSRLICYNGGGMCYPVYDCQ